MYFLKRRNDAPRLETRIYYESVIYLLEIGGPQVAASGTNVGTSLRGVQGGLASPRTGRYITCPPARLRASCTNGQRSPSSRVAVRVAGTSAQNGGLSVHSRRGVSHPALPQDPRRDRAGGGEEAARELREATAGAGAGRHRATARRDPAGVRLRGGHRRGVQRHGAHHQTRCSSSRQRST